MPESRYASSSPVIPAGTTQKPAAWPDARVHRHRARGALRMGRPGRAHSAALLHQRTQRVVIADADFVGGHGIVFVDDRNHAERQQQDRQMSDEIAERLGDRLDTRVKIALSAKKGLISIEFATIGDLNRILTELGETPFGQN